ncbi:MAG TPA: peptidylprolyl isomerase [Candidatus Nanopelagicales bacterium]
MASSNKRQRDLARARYEARQRRRASQSAARRHRQQIIGAITGAVVVIGAIAWFVIAQRSPSTPVAATSPSPSASAPAAAATSVAGCTSPMTVVDKTATWAKAPAYTLKPATTYKITLATNCGNVVIASDPAAVKAAGSVVNSQQFLAGQGFFDAASCFRLTTSGLYVLQCGSPTNDGQGGPGYQLKDEKTALPKDGPNNYPVGTVAMANSGANTTGSQFFLVYKNTTLPPSYMIWGKVVSGLDVLQKVAAAGVEAGASSSTDGAPAQPLVITKATATSVAG